MKHLLQFSKFAVVMSIGILGCQRSPISGAPVLTHKLVVTGNEHSVPVYDNEHSYLETSHMKQEGGPEGMIGDVKQRMTTKQLDDQTNVEIVSSDENGAVITVTDGPMKGQTGFVAKQNVD
jgi:hypothetical protein